MPRPDTFPPSRIHRIVSEFERHMDDVREGIGLANAIYLTEFWTWWTGVGRKFKSGVERTGHEIQVNRLWKEVQVYAAALYPRASRVVCSPDAMGRGEPLVAQAALNGWWEKDNQYSIIHDAVVMAILFPGSGFKVGFDPGTASPIERTWLRPIPPWEMVLDRNATSIQDERYRGHLYQAPIEEVVERFPHLEGVLKGTPRTDFFSGATTAPRDAAAAQIASASDDGEFVRVFEFSNKRDTYTDEKGNAYLGRLEVWVLDQGDLSKAPVSVTALPFADAAGNPLPNVEPLLFAHEPGFPLRPVAPVARLLPQMIELNKLRTAAAGDIRRNWRTGLFREGAINQDALTKAMSAGDGGMVPVTNPSIPFRDVFAWMEHQPIAADTLKYMAIVEGDLERQSGGSQNAREQITGATAYEVQTVQLFTEEGLKFHALILTGTLARVSRLAQRGIIGAGMSSGDSEGGTLAPDASLAPVGTVEGGAPGLDAVPANAPPMTWQAFPLTVDDETVEVTAEALDADFPIAFVEGGRTPITDQAMLTFLTGPGVESYMKLFEMVVAGGPMGILAERIMARIAERADLPKDLHPAELKAAVAKLPKEKPAPPRAGPPPGVAAAIPGGPPPAEPAQNPQNPQNPQNAPGPGESAVMSTLEGVLTALSAVANASPETLATLLPVGQEIVAAIDAAQAGDADALAAGVIGAAEALDGVDLAGPEMDTARTAIGALVEGIRKQAA